MIVEDVIAEHFGITRDKVYLPQNLLDEMDQIISDWSDANKDVIVMGPDSIGENVVCYITNSIDRFIDDHSKENDEDWGEDCGTLVRRAGRKECFMSREDAAKLFEKFPQWQIDVYTLGRNRWHIVPWNEIGMKSVQQVRALVTKNHFMQDIFAQYDPLNDWFITSVDNEELE